MLMLTDVSERQMTPASGIPYGVSRVRVPDLVSLAAAARRIQRHVQCAVGYDSSFRGMGKRGGTSAPVESGEREGGRGFGLAMGSVIKRQDGPGDESEDRALSYGGPLGGGRPRRSLSHANAASDPTDTTGHLVALRC